MFDCNIYSPKGTVWQQIPSLIHLNMLSSGMSWDITKHRLFGHLSFKGLHWRRWCSCLYLEPNMHWLYISRMTWVLGYLCFWLSCINFVTYYTCFLKHSNPCCKGTSCIHKWHHTHFHVNLHQNHQSLIYHLIQSLRSFLVTSQREFLGQNSQESHEW